MTYFVTGRHRLHRQIPDSKPVEAAGHDLCPGAQGVGEKAGENLSLCGGLDANQKRIVPVVGDLGKTKLGISAADVTKMKGKVTHTLSLGRHLRPLRRRRKPTRGQYRRHTQTPWNLPRPSRPAASTIPPPLPAAGLYDGTFREDMFEEAEELDHPVLSAPSTIPKPSCATNAKPPGASIAPAWWWATPRPVKSTRSTGRTTSSS